MRTETIKIVAEGGRGWKIINKDDFDPKADKEYGVKPVRKAPAKKAK